MARYLRMARNQLPGLIRQRTWSASRVEGSVMGRLVRHGLELGKQAALEGSRMSGLEGQANLAQSTERPVGRHFNPGLPKASTTGRKGRKSLLR